MWDFLLEKAANRLDDDRATCGEGEKLSAIRRVCRGCGNRLDGVEAPPFFVIGRKSLLAWATDLQPTRGVILRIQPSGCSSKPLRRDPPNKLTRPASRAYDAAVALNTKRATPTRLTICSIQPPSRARRALRQQQTVNWSLAGDRAGRRAGVTARNPSPTFPGAGRGVLSRACREQIGWTSLRKG